jgi:hypothetical protein
VTHTLEILGAGRQVVVIEGPHKSGAMQYWESGGLVDHIGELPEIDIHQCDALIKAVSEGAEAQGLTVQQASLAHDSNAEAFKVGDITSPHIEEKSRAPHQGDPAHRPRRPAHQL